MKKEALCDLTRASFCRLPENCILCLIFTFERFKKIGRVPRFLCLLNSRRQPLNANYLGALIFLNLLYLLITSFVLHKPWFSRLTSHLLHSLFQLNGLQILTYSITQYGEYCQCQESKIKGDLKSYYIRLLKFIRVLASWHWYEAF